tara:strand:+ start:284 stop:655 length:372 start_codon:yes stop_codon:yes gene_type:complete
MTDYIVNQDQMNAKEIFDAIKKNGGADVCNLPTGDKRVWLKSLDNHYEDENIVFLPLKMFFGDWFVSNGERTGHILEKYIEAKRDIRNSDKKNRKVVGVLIQKDKDGWSFVIDGDREIIKLTE